MISTKFILFISNGETSMRFSTSKTKKRKSISQTCLAALVWKHRHLKSVQCIAAYLLISILNLINVHPQFKLRFYCKSNKPFDSILTIGDSYEMNHPVEWKFFSFFNPHNAQELCIHIFQFLQTVLPNWKSYILHLHSYFYFWSYQFIHLYNESFILYWTGVLWHIGFVLLKLYQL